MWLRQAVDGHHRFVGYYENSGEFIGHYVAWLRDWAAERDVTLGTHYWPHDGDRESLFLEGGTLTVAAKQGMRPSIVQRPVNKAEATATARAHLPPRHLDADGGALARKRLRAARR